MTAKEKTLIRFKERLESGKSIKYNDFKNEDATLYRAVQRYFGGILKICLELGLDEETLVNEYGLTRSINKRTLSEDEIYNRLIYLKSIGKLSTSSMRKEFSDLRLELSIKKRYGSVEKGLAYFGLKRDTVRVTISNLIKEIESYSKSGIDMSYTNMIEVDSKLVSNSVNKMKKSWHTILDDLKVDYPSKYKRLTKTNIQKRLNFIIEKEGEINYYLISKNDSSILYYVYENYESILDFYVDMGLNPEDCMDLYSQKSKGFEFERVFSDLLDTMNLDYDHNKAAPSNSEIRPDFQLPKGTWTDCKLSSWTSTIESTIDKYAPHCEKLIIVFNRGKYEYLPEVDSEKVEFRKIDYYYPYLYQINRQDLIERFESLI